MSPVIALTAEERATLMKRGAILAVDKAPSVETLLQRKYHKPLSASHLRSMAKLHARTPLAATNLPATKHKTNHEAQK